MLNKFSRTIVSFIATLTCIGCGTEGVPDDCDSIRIIYPSGWAVTVQKDGSGTVAYGANMSVPFPANTLGFNEIRDRLGTSTTAVRQRQNDVAVAFRRKSQTSTTARYTTDKKTLRVIFEKVHNAVPPGALGDLWMRYPPLGDG